MQSVVGFLRLNLLRAAYPVLRFCEWLGKPEPKVPFEFYDMVEKMIRPGDILLSRENWRSTNLFIPGDWAHAAIYAPTETDGRVIEAVGKGVREVHLAQWILGKDHLMVLRPVDEFGGEFPARVGDMAATLARAHIGAPYDYLFTSDEKAFYCAELVLFGWTNAWKTYKIDPRLEARMTWGVPTITPSDFSDSRRVGKVKMIALFSDRFV